MEPDQPRRAATSAVMGAPVLGVKSTADEAEIQLATGTGLDINKALRRLPQRGGRVVLGQGVFEIREPIFLDRDNIELQGMGALTILRLAEKSDCPLVVIGPIDTPVPRNVVNVRLRKLVLDGNRHNQSQGVEKESWGGICDNGRVSQIRNNGLTIRGAHQAKIEDVVTRNARSGGVVLEKGCRNVYIDNLESYDNHFDGLACYDAEECKFSRLTLHHNQAAGISLDQHFNNNVVSMAAIRENGSQGIFMRDSNNNTFQKLEVTGNGAQGIFVAQADRAETTPCTNNLFSDMTIMHNRGQGFRVNDDSCIENMIWNSLIKGNQKGEVSQSKEALVTLQKVRQL
jgi:parallel beta-helix repeat protein